jgi:hypothetical protein
VAALIVGSAAPRSWRVDGVGALPLGIATFVLGVGCYAVAIAFVERRQRRAGISISTRRSRSSSP